MCAFDADAWRCVGVWGNTHTKNACKRRTLTRAFAARVRGARCEGVGASLLRLAVRVVAWLRAAAPFGEADLELRAAADVARDGDLSSVSDDDRLADRQSQPDSAVLSGARVIDAVKPLENVSQVLRGNADPRVGNDEHDFARRRPQRDVHLALFVVVADRIGQQIGDDLRDPVGIAGRGGRRGDPSGSRFAAGPPRDARGRCSRRPCGRGRTTATRFSLPQSRTGPASRATRSTSASAMPSGGTSRSSRAALRPAAACRGPARRARGSPPRASAARATRRP